MAAAPDPIVRRSHLEEQAKAAYAIYAHRAGSLVAFEQLVEDHRSAWREVVEFFEQYPECNRCGEPLLCLDCDAEGVKEYHSIQEAEKTSCIVKGGHRNAPGFAATLGSAIAEARAKHNVTLAAAAAGIGISASSLRRLETGLSNCRGHTLMMILFWASTTLGYTQFAGFDIRSGGTKVVKAD